MEQEELNQEVEERELEDAPEIDEGDDGERSEEREPEEPFFKLNDRQVYKTPEDLKKAHEHLYSLSERYRRFGDPDELSGKLAELEAFKKFRDSVPGVKNVDGDGKKDPFKGLDPDRRKAWESATPVLESILESRGYLTREQAEKLAEERAQRVVQSVNAEQQAYSAAKGVLEERGIEATDDRMNALEAVAAGMIQRDPETRELYQSGRYKDLAERLANLVYGEKKVQQQQKSTGGEDGRSRDERGRYRRTDYARAKKQTAGLPKTGPSGGPGISGEGEARPKSKADRTRMAKEIERKFFAENPEAA